MSSSNKVKSTKQSSSAGAVSHNQDLWAKAESDWVQQQEIEAGEAETTILFVGDAGSGE